MQILDIKSGLSTLSVARARFKHRFHQWSFGSPMAKGREHGKQPMDDILPDLERHGVVVVPSFFSDAFCEQARQEFDRVVNDYPDAVHNASNGSDQRVFGIDHVSQCVHSFAYHKDMVGMASRHFRSKTGLLFTLGNRISAIKENNGSGNGWHRDSLVAQFKAITYLSDVDDSQGPFQYVTGSHQLVSIYRDAKLGDFPPRSCRLSDQQVNSILDHSAKRLRSVTGKRGTLILANTTGIHRGAPLSSGVRYALTNYYYPCDRITNKILDHFSPVLGIHVPT